MKIKVITDTDQKDFENKVNEELEAIEVFSKIKGITTTVSHPNKMRGEKIVGVGNFFSSIIAYEERGCQL